MLAVLLLLHGGCADKKPNFLVVAVSKYDASFSEIEKKAAAWGADSGVNVTLAAPSAPTADLQQRELEALLGRHWDVICIEPLGTAEISPLLENAKDRGSVIIALRGRSIRVADYNIEPFSNEEMGERMMESLSAKMRSKGSYITLAPSFEAKNIVDIEDAAVRLQRRSYNGLSLVDRLVRTDANASTARERVMRDIERYSIKGVLFFTTNDGLGAAGQRTPDGGRLAVVGLGDPAALGKKVEDGEIDSLFYWSRSNLTLAGLELGRVALSGRRFEPREHISLNIEGYETLRNSGGGTWTARDIGALNP
ncbi:MAG: substrate-binding domain-containing protein [Synergistaceae bacterium]|nr:substrate-binding domain-containing protein [Synergistaceae bacterium]